MQSRKFVYRAAATLLLATVLFQVMWPHVDYLVVIWIVTLPFTLSTAAVVMITLSVFLLGGALAREPQFAIWGIAGWVVLASLLALPILSCIVVGQYYEARAALSIASIEAYRVAHGHYPADLGRENIALATGLSYRLEPARGDSYRGGFMHRTLYRGEQGYWTTPALF